MELDWRAVIHSLGNAEATAPVALENTDSMVDATCGAGTGSGVGAGAGAAMGAGLAAARMASESATREGGRASMAVGSSEWRKAQLGLARLLGGFYGSVERAGRGCDTVETLERDRVQ